MDRCCLVCGESGGSKHYGSYCCSGCKGFFRRTIRFKKAYKCMADSNCVIEKEYRNCCRACRFQKCITVGLNPLLVHSDRGVTVEDDIPTVVPDLSTSARAPSETRVPKTDVISFDEMDMSSPMLPTCGPFSGTDNHLALANTNIVPTLSSTDTKSICRYFVMVERLCDDFVDMTMNPTNSQGDRFSLNVPVEIAFSQPRAITHRYKIDWTPKSFLRAQGLKKVWCRIVGHFADWASHIPELSLLEDEDKMRMLIGRSIPCIWFLIGHRSFVNKTNGLSLSAGYYFPADEEQQKFVDNEILTLCKSLCELLMTDFVKPMKEMQTTEAEYALIRVLSFFISVPRLSQRGRDIIASARNKYLNVLSDLVQKSNPTFGFSQVVERVGKLLMLIPVIEKISQMEDDTLGMMTVFNVAEMRGELPFEIHVRKNM
uniref:Nuclear Hormone Receptor family n=1 Tax=Steinernema glaseri TaxID=37863 RepID=A0A1I7YMP6_9BILA